LLTLRSRYCFPFAQTLETEEGKAGKEGNEGKEAKEDHGMKRSREDDDEASHPSAKRTNDARVQVVLLSRRSPERAA
jgi:hypothetical protein